MESTGPVESASNMNLQMVFIKRKKLGLEVKMSRKGTVKLMIIIPFWGRIFLESLPGINYLKVVDGVENAPK